MSRPFAFTRACKCCHSPVAYPRPAWPCTACWDVGCRYDGVRWHRAEGCKQLARHANAKRSTARTVAVRRLERV